MSNKKNCHAELVSASTLSIALRFRNKFGMTQRIELIRQPRLGFAIVLLADSHF